MRGTVAGAPSCRASRIRTSTTHTSVPVSAALPSHHCLSSPLLVITIACHHPCNHTIVPLSLLPSLTNTHHTHQATHLKGTLHPYKPPSHLSSPYNTKPPLHHHHFTTTTTILPPLYRHLTTTLPPPHHHSTTTKPPFYHHLTITPPPLHHHSTITLPPPQHHKATTPPLQSHHFTTSPPLHHLTTTSPPLHHLTTSPPLHHLTTTTTLPPLHHHNSAGACGVVLRGVSVAAGLPHLHPGRELQQLHQGSSQGQDLPQHLQVSVVVVVFLVFFVDGGCGGVVDGGGGC